MPWQLEERQQGRQGLAWYLTCPGPFVREAQTPCFLCISVPLLENWNNSVSFTAWELKLSKVRAVILEMDGSFMQLSGLKFSGTELFLEARFVAETKDLIEGIIQ